LASIFFISSSFFIETMLCWADKLIAYCQFFSTFTSSSGEQSTTVFGAHAFSETVFIFPLAIAWLIGSFHCLSSIFMSFYTETNNFNILTVNNQYLSKHFYLINISLIWPVSDIPVRVFLPCLTHWSDNSEILYLNLLNYYYYYFNLIFGHVN